MHQRYSNRSAGGCFTVRRLHDDVSLVGEIGDVAAAADEVVEAPGVW